MKNKKFSSIETIIKIAKKGGMYILVYDENRENEGDLVFCSSDVSAKKINFIFVTKKFHFSIYADDTCIIMVINRDEYDRTLKTELKK